MERMCESIDTLPWWGKAAGVGLGVYAGYKIIENGLYCFKGYKMKQLRQDFINKNRKHKEDFAQKINNRKPGVNDDDIYSLSLQGLQEELQKGKLTASEVLLAYQRKVVGADQKTNCVAMYVTEAGDTAADLDKSEQKGPLHGIPFSFKEMCPLKGYVSTAGCILLTFMPVPKESWVVAEILQEQGAIPFVLSNVPYFGMSFGSSNPLYGETSNPLDAKRHCGGSSSGEAAMVASKASILSLGSDIGGSVRIPAAWCGVVGLKCGSTRLSFKGLGMKIDSITCLVPITFGPISPDVDNAAFVMKHLLVKRLYELDPALPPVPWREEVKYSYAIEKAVPSMERGVRITRDKLQEMGHTVVPFTLPDNDGTSNYHWGDLWREIFFADAGESFQVLVNTDILTDKHCFKTYTMTFPNLPRWFNLLFARTVSLFNRAKGRDMTIGCGTGSTLGFWSLINKVKGWQRACVAAVQEAGLDAIISPAFACPAMLKKYDGHPAEHTSYTYVYNMLDWPAGVLPVAKVTKDDLYQMMDYPRYPPYSEYIRDSMKDAEGLPVNVQVAVLPYQEELCLNIMKQIEEAF